MIDFFVRPWEISNTEETIDIGGQLKTFQQVRQQLYENIVDEAMFVARASEGAVSLEWIMEQPIFIRRKYMDEFQDELKERKQRFEQKNKSHHRR